MTYIWLDDLRKAPEGYIWVHSVNGAKALLGKPGSYLLDLDHDLGDYASDGGDAVKLILWMLENGFHENPAYYFIFRYHTANPVGRENMQALVERYFR